MSRDMSSKPGFWPKCRIAIRWCRIVSVLTLFALVCAGVWFNRVGLPDFLKRPLVQTLRERGFELEFSRLRLRISRGLVADNVRIGLAQTPGSPVFSSSEIQLPLDLKALLHRRLQVNGLVLVQGKLVLPFSPTNSLVLTKIHAELRFQTNDIWSLDNFAAEFAGADIALTAYITHASELQRWEIFHAKKSGGPAEWQAPLKEFSDTLDRIQFDGTPRLNLSVTGDARDLKTFDLRLTASAPGADTPWGGGRGLALSVRAKPKTFDRLPETTMRLEAAEAVTPDGRAHDLKLNAHLALNADAPTNFDAALAWWTNAQPYQLEWTSQLQELKSEKLDADSVACGGFWRTPELAVTNFSAELGGGTLNGGVRLNIATRELKFTDVSTSFDPRAVASLLTEKTQARLAEFSWTEPPLLHADGALILPAWTNRQPDWHNEVRPTIRLAGEMAFTNATVFGAAIDSVHTHFSCTNLFWQLPDLSVAQAKTQLQLAGDEDDVTKDYQCHVHGAFDPAAIRPFLTASNVARGFGIATFAKPVFLDADVRGRLFDFDRLTAAGRMAVTNFAVRGQAMDSVTGAFHYTNRVLEFSNPRLSRDGGAQTMTADAVVLNFNTRLISFTNGFSTADPKAIVRAIGPKTAKLIAPYEFLRPPVARVNGRVPLRDVNGGRDLDDADMKFEILQGAPFRWTKLETTNIVGTIHWQGQTLVLTNVIAKIYGGEGTGFANFDFRAKHKGADYQFAFSVSNLNLHLLASGLASATNRLEGVLSGEVVVTNASTENLQSWNGYGQAHLRDGMLWDVSIFGIFSPVLNAISPGLGNSQAKEAAAKFSITNGVIATDSLEIRSTMTRLQYAGTVDLRGNLNARVNAQLLRNTPVVGPLVSDLLWPVFWTVGKVFEYRVTGTLKNPKSDPVFVPKSFMMMLHPIRSFESLLPADDEFPSSPTNAPPDK